MDKGVALGLEVIEGTDNEVHTLDDAIVAELRTIGDAQTEAWIEEVTAKGLPGQEMVDFARELVEKYSAAM